MEKQVVQVTINQVKLRIIQGDITDQDTDAIVNAVNSSLLISPQGDNRAEQ